MAAAEAARALVVELARSLRAPVHIAALSVAYKQRTGHSIKQDYKPGMLRFVKEVCADSLLTMGEGNDTFVRLATPVARNVQWVRDKVTGCGPILVSMLGRMYHEEFGSQFQDSCGEGLNKFLKRHFEHEFSFEVQKGQVRTCRLTSASRRYDCMEASFMMAVLQRACVLMCHLRYYFGRSCWWMSATVQIRAPS